MANLDKLLSEIVRVVDVGEATTNACENPRGRLSRLLLVSDFLSLMLGLSAAVPLTALFMSAPATLEILEFRVLVSVVAAPSLLAINVVSAAVTISCFFLAGHYDRRRVWFNSGVGAAAIIVLFAAAQALLFDFSGAAEATAPFLLSWVLAMSILLISRGTVRGRAVETNLWFEPSVVVGAPSQATQLADIVRGDEAVGLSITHIIQAGGVAASDGNEETARPVEQKFGKIFERFRDHHILVCPRPEDYAEADALIQSICLARGTVGVILSFPGFLPQGGHRQIVLADGSTLVWVRNRLSQPLWQATKRCFDIFASAALLFLLAPLFGAAWVCGRLSKAPAFYGHKRIGRFGRPFTCYKFRTMVPNADAVLTRLLATDPAARREWETGFKLRNDPRVTRFGAVLRRTSLDELPQIWNVFKGDMSLVGPRPVVEEELDHYGAEVMVYLSVRPGITGLWQIGGRSDARYEKRVVLDRSYVRNWSIASDISILWRTVKVVLSRVGAY